MSSPLVAGQRRRTAPGTVSVHGAVICVAAPALAVSAPDGQLRGEGLDGFYRDGRRTLSRCELTVGGTEPITLQARLLDAGRARFMAVVRTPGDRGPDPVVTVERVRSAAGSERITLVNTGPVRLRLPVECALGTDLAAVSAVAAGQPGPDLPGSVSGSGLRWERGGESVRVTAAPAPGTVLAATGVLKWELELPPGAARTIELRVEAAPVRARGTRREGVERPPPMWSGARLESDDPRAGALLDASLGDLQALLLRTPEHPADTFAAAGAPWRLGLAPADALWTARMLLPFGTRLAAGTLRTLARLQDPGTGRVPGVPRHSGPHLPPLCSGVEATLLFVTVLAEARRWGLPEREVEPLLPAAERCLDWLRGATTGTGLVTDPVADGPLRAEVQAHAHRTALHGADLLEAHGRGGAEEWRDFAVELRGAFRERFWIGDRGGGRPASALAAGGRPVPVVSSSLAHLLDTGLLEGGTLAAGLLDKAQTEQLGRLLGAPDLDSGWGLRTLSARTPGFNPFGHRGGAVRVHETAVAVSGLAAAGLEKEASALVGGVLDAAVEFGLRLPEMYGGERRSVGAAPCPHPMACRPAAVAAAGAVHVLAALAGVRPDAPGGTVAVRPIGAAPLGEVRLSGMRVAEEPFSVRVSRLGMAMIEEAAPGLRLGR